MQDAAETWAASVYSVPASSALASEPGPAYGVQALRASDARGFYEKAAPVLVRVAAAPSVWAWPRLAIRPDMFHPFACFLFCNVQTVTRCRIRG